MSRSARERSWSAEEKLALVLESYAAKNLARFCRERGIDRSYLYQLRADLEKIALEDWAGRRPGRPSEEDRAEPGVLLDELKAARETIEGLELQTRKLTAQCEVQGLLLGFVERNLKKKPSSRRRGST